ncbi:MAG: DMT family transporter [Bacteroidales bacterium]|nr:DMT family transporter [Bacteroidales bacterium]
MTENKAGSKALGYLYGAAAAASYGLNPTFALPLYADGMNPDSVLMLRYLFAILMLVVMMLLRRRSFKIPPTAIPQVFVLGMLMSLSSLTLFLSYNYMAAGIASTMLFVYPIMVAVIMTLFYKEHLSVLTTLCIILAFFGVMLLYRNAEGESLSMLGTIFVMLSALSYSIYLVAINSKSLEKIPTLTLTFYVVLFGSLLFVGRLLTDVPLILPSSPLLWLDAVALAFFPTAFSLICTTRAIQLIGSTQTSILGALEPVTAIFMGILLFNESVTPRECCGIFLILFAVSMVIGKDSMENSVVAKQLMRMRLMFPKGKRK